MSKYKNITILVFVVLLNACAATYVQPGVEQASSTVRGSLDSKSLFTWNKAVIDAIDGKGVVNFISETSKMRIMPGKHNLIINASFNRGLMGSGPFYSIVDLPLTVRVGGQYVIKTRNSGAKIKVWAVDGANRRVSPIVTSSYQPVPHNTTVFIPVNSH